MNIVVTGASSGIGYEAVLEFVSDSANSVIAIARSEENLQSLSGTAAIFNPQSNLYTLPFDIVHGDHADELVPFIKSCIGSVDILVNNAGALINKPFTNTTQLEFASMFQSNFLGHVKMIQHLLPLMNSGGHIINIGSMGGFQGSVKFPGLAAYSASKAALHALTECLAFELAETNVRINCLALGSAQTEMLNNAFPGYESPVSAADMGKFVADFAMNGSMFFNGKVLPVSVTTP